MVTLERDVTASEMDLPSGDRARRVTWSPVDIVAKRDRQRMGTIVRDIALDRASRGRADPAGRGCRRWRTAWYSGLELACLAL